MAEARGDLPAIVHSDPQSLSDRTPIVLDCEHALLGTLSGWADVPVVTACPVWLVLGLHWCTERCRHRCHHVQCHRQC